MDKNREVHRNENMGGHIDGNRDGIRMRIGIVKRIGVGTTSARQTSILDSVMVIKLKL